MRYLIRPLFFILCFFFLAAGPLHAQTDFFLPGEQLLAPLKETSVLSQHPNLRRIDLSAVLPFPAENAPEEESHSFSLIPLLDDFDSAAMPRLQEMERTIFASGACGACRGESPALQASVKTTIPAETAQPRRLAHDRAKTWLRQEIKAIHTPDVWKIYLYVEKVSGGPLKNSWSRDGLFRQTFKAVYVKPAVDENKRIRDLWKETLGVDVWYPYFKFKDVERWVKERFSFRIRKMKCKPQIERGRFFYICKKTF